MMVVIKVISVKFETRAMVIDTVIYLPSYSELHNYRGGGWGTHNTVMSVLCNEHLIIGYHYFFPKTGTVVR